MPPRPMLCQSIEPKDVDPYLSDDDWLGQRKLDGHRILLVVEDGQVSALGRSGQSKVTGLNQALFSQFKVFEKGLWQFDGELIGSQLVLYDMVTAGGQIRDNASFPERYQVLRTLYELWTPDAKLVGLLPIATGTVEKKALWQEAQDNGWEGIILRHRLGQYRGGSRSSHLLKVKMVRDAEFIITAVGLEGHDNVELALLDPENNRVVKVGRASAIGKKPRPEPLQVWSVRYLYVLDRDNPRLYQPRLMSLRDDKDPSECLIDQISNSFTSKEFTDKVRAEL